VKKERGGRKEKPETEFLAGGKITSLRLFEQPYFCRSILSGIKLFRSSQCSLSEIGVA